MIAAAHMLQLRCQREHSKRNGRRQDEFQARIGTRSPTHGVTRHELKIRGTRRVHDFTLDVGAWGRANALQALRNVSSLQLWEVRRGGLGADEEAEGWVRGGWLPAHHHVRTLKITKSILVPQCKSNIGRCLS